MCDFSILYVATTCSSWTNDYSPVFVNVMVANITSMFGIRLCHILQYTQTKTRPTSKPVRRVILQSIGRFPDTCFRSRLA